jgi:hypothetical protein
VIRSVAVVSAALRLAAPQLSDGQVAVYAPILRSEGKARSFDPFTLIAMVRGESRWRAHLVGGMDGQCIGLGQICLHFQPGCRGGDFQNPLCLGRKAQLLQGPVNLRYSASLITANRAFCRRRTGRPALFARWLSSYQGWNNRAQSGRQGIWCNMRRGKDGRWRDVKVPRMTRDVMAYRRELIRRLGLR